jgi:hypothetical protein
LLAARAGQAALPAAGAARAESAARAASLARELHAVAHRCHVADFYIDADRLDARD